MTYDLIKKNVYYDAPSEFPHSSRNHAEDFQDFHLPLGRIHHAAVHDRGIVAGLEVSGAAGASAVTVAAGAAIDSAGQLMVLSTLGHGDIGADPPNGNNNEVPVPVVLPLAAMANKTVYLTIQYALILRAAEGSGGRLEQVPWLRLQPATGNGAYVDDGSAVVLAIVKVNPAGMLLALVEVDAGLPLGRRLMSGLAGEFRVRRPVSSADELQETVAGRIKAAPGGGLQLSVPNAGDTVFVSRDDGTHCGGVDLRADTVVCRDGLGNDVVHIDTAHAWLRVGAKGNEGDLLVVDQNGNLAFAMNGSQSRLDIGTKQNPGKLFLRDAAAEPSLNLDGATGSVNANHLNPFAQSATIDVGARFFRIHGFDLVLDGRSGGNKRALVDGGGRLVVNYAGDYADGVDIAGLHLAPHIQTAYWEGSDTSKRPTYNQWVVLFEAPTSLAASEWDQVSMCEIGMLDNGGVNQVWWGARRTSFVDGAGHWVIQWQVNYHDTGDDWRPWFWNVTMIAFRR